MTQKLLVLLVFLLIFHGLYAQERALTGKVSDENGAPLVGATIVLKGSTKGTNTNAEGAYQIMVPREGGVLVISFIGYKPDIQDIGTRSVIDAVLNSDVTALSEIVVVGYGTQRKSDLTGAVVSVKMEDATKIPAATTDQILQGRASGVSVTTNSGSPGTPVQIRIRGVGTINDASPLFVVDGLPLDDISFLNPSDIETMQILKDASATAIYGSRGANGVIMITTKNGKGGEKHLFNVDVYAGNSRMWKEPSMCNAWQWAMLNDEAQVNAGNPVTPALANYKSFGVGTDWIKAVMQIAQVRNYNISIAGNNEKISYFASAGDLKQDGIVTNSSFERISGRLNVNVTPRKWLSFGENLSIEDGTTHKVNEADEWDAILIQAITLDPITPVKRPNGYYSASDYVQSNNPVAHLHYGKSDGPRDILDFRTVGNVFAELTFFKGFSLKSNFGFDYKNENGTNFVPTFTVYNSTGPVIGQSVVHATLEQRNEVDQNWSWSNYLNYQKQFGKNDLTVMAGMESSEERTNWFDVKGSDYLSNDPDLANFNNSVNPIASATGTTTAKNMYSYFGRINYAHEDKYLATFNIRRDGSSYFGPDDQYGVFPAFSLGWVISKENFMKSFEFINTLKLRAGWGSVGNDKITPYGYYTQAASNRPYVLNNTITDGVSFPSLGNPNLHWETTTTTNVGLDLGLWQNKLTFSGEYYIKTTTDMLVAVPLAGDIGVEPTNEASGGTYFPFQNIGKMQNKGFEFEIDFKNTIQDFSYDLGFNVSTYQNKVLDLGPGGPISTAPLRNTGNVSWTQVGSPVAQFYGYKTQGLFQTNSDVQSWTDNSGTLLQPNAGPGDIRYAKGSDGELYQGIIGSPLPKYTYGLNLQLGFKGFDLNVFLQGVYGNHDFNGTMVYTERTDAAQNLSTRMLNRWTGPGTTNDAHTPRLNAADANNLNFSDRFVEDGSYMRIKNLQIGYSLPKALVHQMHVEKCRFYVAGTNLLTFTKYTGFDPEIGAGYFGSLDQGIDRATYPQARTFTAGLNLTF